MSTHSAQMVCGSVFPLLLVSFCSYYSHQPRINREWDLHCDCIHKHWSKHLTYAKILNNGLTTPPSTWTNPRELPVLTSSVEKKIYDNNLAGQQNPTKPQNSPSPRWSLVPTPDILVMPLPANADKQSALPAPMSLLQLPLQTPVSSELHI